MKTDERWERDDGTVVIFRDDKACPLDIRTATTRFFEALNEIYKHQVADMAEREIVLTRTRGRYGMPTLLVIEINGSPPRATLVLLGHYSDTRIAFPTIRIEVDDYTHTKRNAINKRRDIALAIKDFIHYAWPDWFETDSEGSKGFIDRRVISSHCHQGKAVGCADVNLPKPDSKEDAGE